MLKVFAQSWNSTRQNEFNKFCSMMFDTVESNTDFIQSFINPEYLLISFYVFYLHGCQIGWNSFKLVDRDIHFSSKSSVFKAAGIEMKSGL